MLRTILLLLPLATASAATIVIVNCNGSAVSDPTSAQCKSLDEFAAASAVSPSYISASASAGSLGSASANASLSGTYLLTVTGGTGSGFFLPCLGVATDQVGTVASASFGPYNISSSGPHPHNPSSTCASMGLASASSFVYGVGQEVEINMSVSVQPVHQTFGDASAGLGDFSAMSPFPAFEFWNPNGAPLSKVSYSLAQVSEPGNFGVLLVVLLISCAAQRQLKPLPG